MPTERKDLGSRFISIASASDRDVYRGPLKDKVIQPGSVRAVWYPEARDSPSLSNMESGEYLLFHFHGGGYVLGSPLPLDSGYFAGVFSKYITPKVLFAGYRLTCVPEGRFPVALQDVVTAYLHVLSLGVPAENIIVSGDSAGGHLVISLLKYISEYLPDTPGPKAALLWSPWIDITAATPAHHVRQRKNYSTDYLPADFAEWATESFAEGIVDRNGPYVTLKAKPFRTRMKFWAHVGDAELLYDEVVEWVQDVREAGNDVTMRIEHGAPHDIVESGHIKAAKAAAEWL
ncbi:alpha beta hydrolase fold-3 domain containing [Fusarium agapanthi]|uniref:Alpha beta hydrolase fold-3 domain containing n=1 Tax=Fusarium agapanthi TaxID=1803897 RepID=A0A9P5B5M4_9HYPO|nr:alpha beta hydrolase fold-3 domain containing [Fusarium agapanthi]